MRRTAVLVVVFQLLLRQCVLSASASSQNTDVLSREVDGDYHGVSSTPLLARRDDDDKEEGDCERDEEDDGGDKHNLFQGFAKPGHKYAYSGYGSGLSREAILGIAIGSAAFLILLVTLIACLLCKRRRKSAEKIAKSKESAISPPDYSDTELMQKPPPAYSIFSEKPETAKATSYAPPAGLYHGGHSLYPTVNDTQSAQSESSESRYLSELTGLQNRELSAAGTACVPHALSSGDGYDPYRAEGSRDGDETGVEVGYDPYRS